VTARERHRLGALLLLTLVSNAAEAQEIPLPIAIGFLSPLVAIVMAAILGVVARSWRAALINIGLICVWVLGYLAVIHTFTADWIIYTPIALYGIHCIVLSALLGWAIVRRLRGQRGLW